MKRSALLLAGSACIAGLLFSATPIIAATEARTKYTKCLQDYANSQLQLKTDADAFKATAAKKCMIEQHATKQETIKDEISFGSSKSEAAEFANEDVQEMLRLLAERYADLLANNSRFPD